MSKCPKCGLDSYAETELSRLRKRMDRVEKEYTRLKMGSARQEAQSELMLWDKEEGMRYLQQKTRRQAAVIRRLEKRLLAQGDEPYREDVEHAGA